MFDWMKGIILSKKHALKSEDKQTIDERPTMCKSEGKHTTDERPSTCKNEERAQKRFAREHSKRGRAREKALRKQWEGDQKFAMRGSFVTIAGGGGC
ncbi:hypothetical protein N7520_008366 [Penicillium odoratum]|uniref:uncharacterized protein n=1 Tax=Penicillium odoratum TaxID=1167516 RepID=UPI00254962E1|nr:uncharacterized protein N7520_008366 [Penicillium odoratum]KAJ5761210.1 hypothetical protein N7520_008366 [Penicillium odoratum]